MPPTVTTPAPVAPASTISTIKDPVTGNSYSRDTSVAGSTYQPVAPAAGSPAPSGGAPATPATPGSTDTSAEDQVAQSLGYKSYADAVSSLTAAPTTSDTDLYNQAYSAAGLDQLQSTILGKQNDLASAQSEIDDNPWLDEADRVGRNKTVTDLANADIKNMQSDYATKLKAVEDLVTRETADNTATTASNKAKLAALEAQAKAATTAQTAATKTASAAPKTVKSASGATYQWNPTTQSFDQIFAGKAPAAPKVSTSDAISGMEGEIQGLLHSTKTDGTPYSIDGYISPQDWNTALQAWNAQGLSTSSFLSNFKQYANPNDTYTGITKSKSSTSTSSSSAPTTIPGISLAGSTQAFA